MEGHSRREGEGEVGNRGEIVGLGAAGSPGRGHRNGDRGGRSDQTAQRIGRGYRDRLVAYPLPDAGLVTVERAVGVHPQVEIVGGSVVVEEQNGDGTNGVTVGPSLYNYRLGALARYGVVHRRNVDPGRGNRVGVDVADRDVAAAGNRERGGEVGPGRGSAAGEGQIPHRHRPARVLAGRRGAGYLVAYLSVCFTQVVGIGLVVGGLAFDRPGRQVDDRLIVILDG